MNLNFLESFMERTDFPPEAAEAFMQAGGQLRRGGWEEAMDGVVEFFYENGFSVATTQPLIDDLAQNTGLSPYTLWELALIFAAETARTAYLERGTSEEIFYDTFCDLRYKALECKRVKGVWGNFVAFWYPIFYTCDIVKLGRLEYETRVYNGPAFQGKGFSLMPGDRVKSIHIPSSGEPFDQRARLESYRKAYQFFQEELAGGPLVCMCHSWLLYPEYRNVLPEGSNILSFMEDFHILKVEDSPMDDAWRVFGASGEGSAEHWPQETRMQRAFRSHVLAGGKTGSALGVLAFDGEKLL